MVAMRVCEFMIDSAKKGKQKEIGRRGGGLGCVESCIYANNTYLHVHRLVVVAQITRSLSELII